MVRVVGAQIHDAATVLKRGASKLLHSDLEWSRAKLKRSTLVRNEAVHPLNIDISSIVGPDVLHRLYYKAYLNLGEPRTDA